MDVAYILVVDLIFSRFFIIIFVLVITFLLIVVVLVVNVITNIMITKSIEKINTFLLELRECPHTAADYNLSENTLSDLETFFSAFFYSDLETFFSQTLKHGFCILSL